MTRFKTLLLAAALVAPVAAPVAAQAQTVAVANPEQAIGASRAWATARTQIETTYKAQLDQAEARRQAVGKELQPLVTAFNTARAAPNANQASLQQQATTIQTREQAAQAEIQRITLPAQRAQAYAIEQISAKLPDAVQAVVRARNVSMLVRPDAVLFAGPTADVTSAITTELDRLVPTVSVTPPANWQPGQQQGASAAAAPAAAPAARPAQPAGR
ncbi:Skp family chaperone for outer membrane proteins [Sphingomonas sp. SORGH_AS802]|jgi:Skp family chaperone for outer membrane proteins|uniref:OmpH family outer membrane protein n=1 Tax=unclassified Sphingomonas TaxID=196159 RepID=UPI002860162A|nr:MULTISPECIES: OmpH family outer membrane protein [unclassified Sphingomonas]MDR6127286.1 Skp family chaperone for outer membrane proteins [Sphingomonas sp. SORGH_AS_0438]MDR6133797.1 Skp family chaperone for outer membrane proteins [Sphingomonas sp. SORGH_AS_0802]